MTTKSPVKKFHQYLVESEQSPVETIELVAMQAGVTPRCVRRYIRSKLASSPECACYRYVVPPPKEEVSGASDVDQKTVTSESESIEEEDTEAFEEPKSEPFAA